MLTLRGIRRKISGGGGGGGVDNTALQDINTHIDIHVGLDVDGRL